MLNWNTTSNPHTIIHAASLADKDTTQVRAAIEAATEKAVALLTHNIQDNSLYLLFEWQAATASLNIVVSDASKTQDAPAVVRLSLPALELNTPEAQASYSDTVKFWLHDYLSTCTAFFSYSLVAIFHNSSRAHTELL